MSEQWRAIVGYEGLYEVSNMGRIRTIRLSKFKILSQYISCKGYKKVGLSKNGKQKVVFVHRCVAMAFIPNPYNLPQVNHKDENKQNNNVDNLEWCTNKYNSNYGTIQERLNESRKKRWIPVIGINKNGTKITFSSIKKAADFVGGNYQIIGQCCRKEQGRENAYGYTWRYEDEEKHNYYVHLREKTAKKKATPVIAVSNDGSETYFASIKQAVEVTGADRTSIIRSCKSRKYRSGGYIWRYALKQNA